jgi:hypothetical protein
MSFDRKDWLAAVEQRNAERRAVGMPQLHQAEVAAERLMEDQIWRVYQQTLQGVLEHIKDCRITLIESLRVPRDDVEFRRAQVEVARCEGWIEALDSAIGLPKQILEGADKALESITKATKKVTSSAAKAAH